ncbi:MAG: hypothetical protein AAB580_00040 [Patescibacteria group bacterium]
MPNKLALLITFVLSLFLASPTQAKVITQEKGNVSIPANEVINDDLFVAADSVDISGTVNGDIYIGAGTVNFSGKVSGDLVIGAGTVSINQATIGDSLIVGAGTVTIDAQSRIGGSLLAGVGTLDNQARIGRNFMAGAGTIKLNALVNGEAMLGSGSLALGPQAMINGDLTYATEEKLDQAQTALVKGKVTQYQAPEVKHWDAQKRSAKLALRVISFFGVLLTGLVILWLFRIPVVAAAEKINLKFIPSLGWGLIIVFVTPPALFLLAITGIGLPLAILGGLLFLIDLYVAKIFASLALGKALQRYFNWQKLSVPATFSIGLVVYYLLRLIPGIGFFVHLVALLTGLGGCWLSCRTRIRT